MSELRLTNVSTGYDGRQVLRGVSLTVVAAEVVVVLGPSGSGKSTLLRAVAGLEPLLAGSIELADRSLAGVPPYRRGVGMMFQEHALFAHLDVAGNVGFGLRMQRWPKARRTARVAQMLELVGLVDRSGAAIDELSGGERQRVALARTLAPEPGVVLLDEPLGALDRVLRLELLNVLRESFAATAATVLYVTHDVAEAFALADRLAILRDGVWVQVGPPGQLAAAPADDWVARLLDGADG